MGARSLRAKCEAWGQPVEVTVHVDLETLLLLDSLGEQVGLNRTQVIEDAIGAWRVRREHSVNRQNRLRIERALKEALDRRPAAEILADFKDQMEAIRSTIPPDDAVYMNGNGAEHKDVGEGLTSRPGSDMNQPMPNSSEVEAPTLRQRREALGISREKLAHKADISSASIEQFEAGARPKRSKALERLEATLREQERIVA